MTQDELQAIYADLLSEFDTRLNVRARSFAAGVQKAGRRLPPSARRAAAQLQELETRLAHPKLAQRTDSALAETAAAEIRAAIAHHKPGALAARDRAVRLADIGGKVLVVLGLILALLYLAGQTD